MSDQNLVGRGTLGRRMLQPRPSASERAAMIANASQAAKDADSARQMMQQVDHVEDGAEEPDWESLERESQGKPAAASSKVPAAPTPSGASESRPSTSSTKPPPVARSAFQRAAAMAAARKESAALPRILPETLKEELLPAVGGDPIFKMLETVRSMTPVRRVQVLEAATKGMAFDVLFRDPSTGRRFIIDKSRIYELSSTGLVPMETIPEFIKGYNVRDSSSEDSVIEDGKLTKRRTVKRSLKLEVEF